MEGLPVNLGDVGIAAMLLVSALLAFARGFVREVFAVFGWIAAIFATIYGVAHAKPIAERFLEPEWLAGAAAGAGLFLVTLIVATIIAGAIARRIRASQLGPLDRSLGFLFGLARGAVIVCLAFLVLQRVYPGEDQPAWLSEARARPLVETGALLLLSLAPEEVRRQAAATVDEARATARDAAKAKDLYEKLASPPPAREKAAGAAGDMGYKNADRNELERLLEAAE